MARTFHIKLSELVIRITTLHDETFELCRDYLYGGDSDPAPESEADSAAGSASDSAAGSAFDSAAGSASDIVVVTDQAAIDHEREVDALGDFSDAYYETLAVYRAIAEELPRFGRLLMHGSAVAIGERAWLFMAPSGTGKSTHTRWWRTVFADQGPYMVNDDKPIVRIADGEVIIYGTPWDGKERLSTNKGVRLAGIGLLERGQQDSAIPLDAGIGITDLMRHTYRPANADAMRSTMAAIVQVARCVPLYRVAVTNSAHAAETTHAAMAGE